MTLRREHTRAPMRGTRRVFVAALLLAAAPGGGTPPALTTPANAAVHEERLTNGLHALARQIPGSGEVVLAVVYRAGTAFEQKGEGGVAHLVEHLSFHGTGPLGSRDWERERPLLAEIGALAERLASEDRQGEDADFAALAAGRRRLAELTERQRELAVPLAVRRALDGCGAVRHTASTGRDFVVYLTVIHPGALDCALAVEARRMTGRSLRGFFDEQRSVLEELAERRRDPRVTLAEAAAAAAWPEHPYGRSNWGTAWEIRLLTPGRADRFYRRHYTPANAVVAVVGDLMEEEALAAIEGAFAGIADGEPAPPLPPLPDIGPAAVVHAGSSPWFALVWQWPARGSRDLPALRVLSEVLAGRLRSTLLAPHAPLADDLDLQEMAVGGAAGGLTLVCVRARNGAALAAIGREVEQQVDRLRREPVPSGELVLVRDRLRSRIEKILGTPLALARELAVSELQTGSGEDLLDLPAAISTVDADEMSRVAHLHLDPRHLLQIHLIPGG